MVRILGSFDVATPCILLGLMGFMTLFTLIQSDEGNPEDIRTLTDGIALLGVSAANTIPKAWRPPLFFRADSSESRFAAVRVISFCGCFLCYIMEVHAHWPSVCHGYWLGLLLAVFVMQDAVRLALVFQTRLVSRVFCILSVLNVSL